ncbi:carbamoyltransferase HypF [Campylobacter showae]|uniref:carbamoyltransferase HypF n=1 Tax=Campylobacter showae TaxID=204 RepID=UPI000F075AEE|nr:carbamoyltransferase HypF [Campylobacter showae]
MKRCFKYEISGLVQGVGFRPFVYNLALKFSLAGEIYNDDEGVKLTLCGPDEQIEKFEKALHEELPSLARIDEMRKTELEDAKFDEFKIVASKSAKKHAPILPDFALCTDCEREFYDPADPRYHYPFINCTNCGPRFSIIKSLPYDRANTTMNSFKMCEFCGGEYKNPLNRRYHAQPVSCPNCGPRLALKDKFGRVLALDNDSAKQAARLINEGKILAVKGLGGFHLMCRLKDDTVRLLRERKKRPRKPFAVMCKDVSRAKKYARISPEEERLLSSNLKPIVVLQSLPGAPIPSNLAPGLNKIGIFLPYTGIHLLLFEYLDGDVIATSANVSGEPIIYDEKDLREKLGSVIDFYLDNDREIHSPSDDSIAFVAGGEPIFIRTSRGVHPKFIRTKFKSEKTVLAVGAELKNQFAIFKDGELMISPYIGDLKNVATYERFCALINLFSEIYELKFDEIVADLHPHFLNLKWAREYAANLGPNITQIQHHHAHLLSVILENDLDAKREYLGFCFDGTGYGADGSVWGGEILKVRGKEYERVCKFDEILLIGGEASVKNIWQIAYAAILKYDLECEAEAFLAKFEPAKLKNIKILHEKQINCVKTSSLGRIFDAFAAVILGLDSISYEGEAGMSLEALFDANLDVCYEFEIRSDKICFKEAFKRALNDDAKTAATGFIKGLAKLVADVACAQPNDVLLAGGVFQNKALLENVILILKQKGKKYYINKNFSSNDSSVAIGQIALTLI